MGDFQNKPYFTDITVPPRYSSLGPNSSFTYTKIELGENPQLFKNNPSPITVTAGKSYTNESKDKTTVIFSTNHKGKTGQHVFTLNHKPSDNLNYLEMMESAIIRSEIGGGKQWEMGPELKPSPRATRTGGGSLYLLLLL
jgi:hypothetical protein